MLMELAKIKFLDKQNKISVNGVVKTFEPYLRFVLKRYPLFCIKPFDINFCSRTIICSVIKVFFAVREIRICIILQALKKITV